MPGEHERLKPPEFERVRRNLCRSSPLSGPAGGRGILRNRQFGQASVFLFSRAKIDLEIKTNLWAQANKALKRVKVETNHTKGKRAYVIQRLGEESAEEFK